MTEGEKYHFMRRAESATVKGAHKEAVELIRKEAINWIRLMIRVLYTYRQHGRNRGSTTFLRKQAASHLAIALHFLQDFFSPGHTKRARYEYFQYP